MVLYDNGSHHIPHRDYSFTMQESISLDRARYDRFKLADIDDERRTMKKRELACHRRSESTGRYDLLRPGDYIQWQYASDGVTIKKDYVWSSVMGKMAFVGGDALVVSYDGSILSWLNIEGFFTAQVQRSNEPVDMILERRGISDEVVPQVITRVKEVNDVNEH